MAGFGNATPMLADHQFMLLLLGSRVVGAP